MFNNLKIGTKIGGGFIILLLLTAGLAVVAWNGLSGVTDRVDKADDMNRLVQYILDARIREKDYMLETDAAYVGQMRQLLEELREQTRQTRDVKFQEPANKQQMDQVLNKVDAYEQAFLQYVEQERLKGENMASMHRRAREALAEAEAIRTDQQAQLERAREEAARERALYSSLMEDANRVTEAALIVLNSEKAFLVDGAERHLRGMGSRLDEIRSLSGTLQEALSDPALKRAAGKIATAADEYLAAFDAWRAGGPDGDRRGLQRVGRKLMGAARPVKNALADLEFETGKRVKAFTEDKRTQAEDANLLVKWFIEARADEKELIISGDDQYRQAVDERLTRIGSLAEAMKARFKEQKNIDQVTHFSQALATYTDNFHRFADLMAQQRVAEEQMLDTARSAQEVCLAARRGQGLKMQLQIGDANTLMAAAVAVAMVFGLLVAVVITRGITRPLGRANAIARGIAGGDLDQRVDITGGDEIGQLGASLSVMIENLRKDIAATRRRADEASRIRMALDVCSTNVVVADSQRRIIYQNHSSGATLEQIQEALRRDLADLDARQFVGSALDAFHPEPETRRADLEALEEVRRDDLVLGGRHLRLIATPVFNSDGDRLGTAMEWTDRTQEVNQALAEQARAEEAARIADENLRIRVALDNVSSSVMMADRERNIVYMNKRVQALFREAEQDIRKDLPGFEAGRLMGASIDLFHREPARQERLLDTLTRPHVSDLHVGGHTLRIVANPVFSDAGERLGTAVEWNDRTDEVAVEDEVESIVAAARSGNLEQRIDLVGKSGFFEQLGQSVNGLLDLVGSVFDDLARVMSALSEGDLTQPIRGRYRGKFGRVKQDVNNTLINLERIVRELRGASDLIHTASGEISTGNANLSRRTEENAANLEQTASSMEQLTSAVSANADHARQANQLSANARQLAQKGGEVVGRAVSAMGEINDASNRIAEIIGVIDEIAFQTNLLALNASVEAARAGEQGRGFAVVAAEVRNLASRSAAAAKEIKELIRDSVGKVEVGTELVNRSGETLEEIMAGVTRVGDIIAEIVAASSEQSVGIEQVNRAVTQMDESSQQNAALAEQTSSAAVSLTEKAREMDRLMGFFKMRRNPDEDWDLGDDAADEFSFMDAKAAHIAWRQRLRDFLDGSGTLTQDEAVSHRDCRLGRWLYDEGALDRFRDITEMAEMESEHETIHRLIQEIVRLKQAGDDAGAEQRFKEIAPLSNKIVFLLKTIEQGISDSGEAA